MEKQLQPNDLNSTNKFGNPIVSLQDNNDMHAGVDDAMVQKTMEQEVIYTNTQQSDQNDDKETMITVDPP
eukprot:15364462-Ditylum_brightwellii.AAC.1